MLLLYLCLYAKLLYTKIEIKNSAVCEGRALILMLNLLKTCKYIYIYIYIYIHVYTANIMLTNYCKRYDVTQIALKDHSKPMDCYLCWSM